MIDYMTFVDRQGNDLVDPIPLMCDDCGRPTVYDRADENYHHAVDCLDGCFLCPSENRPDDPLHPRYEEWKGMPNVFVCGACMWTVVDRYRAVAMLEDGRCQNCGATVTTINFSIRETEGIESV